MAIGSIMQTGLEGMRTSQNKISQSADQIVKASTLNKDTSSNGDIIEPIVDMKAEQHVFDASAKIVKAADEMLGTLMNIKA